MASGIALNTTESIYHLAAAPVNAPPAAVTYPYTPSHPTLHQSSPMQYLTSPLIRGQHPSIEYLASPQMAPPPYISNPSQPSRHPFHTNSSLPPSTQPFRINPSPPPPSQPSAFYDDAYEEEEEEEEEDREDKDDEEDADEDEDRDDDAQIGEAYSVPPPSQIGSVLLSRNAFYANLFYSSPSN